MNVKKYKILSLVLGMLLLALLTVNIVILIDTQSSPQPAPVVPVSENQSALFVPAESRVEIESESISAPDSLDFSKVVPSASGHNAEQQEIIWGAENFLEAYHSRDSDVPYDEHWAELERYITEGGKAKLSETLIRPGEYHPDLHTLSVMGASNVYLRRSGEKYAEMFSAVYVIYTKITEAETTRTSDIRLIGMSMEREADGIWRVSDVTYERAMSASQSEKEALFG